MSIESSTNAWGVTLSDPQLVSYQGKTLAFAREKNKKTDTLYFRVLNTLKLESSANNARWSEWFRFYFPDATASGVQNQLALTEQTHSQLRIAGMDLLTLDEDTPIGENIKIVDASDSAFFIITDDKYIYCFRHSSRNSLYLNRLILSGDVSTTENGDEIATYCLEIAWEARFQHSGEKDLPASKEDKVGYVDRSGSPFATPTIELNQIKSTGLFTVARVPTAVPGASVWYFLYPSETAYILHAIHQQNVENTDFADWSEAQVITTKLEAKGIANAHEIKPSQTLAPTMTFYAEHEPVETRQDESVEIQRSGRLMFVAPVITTINGLKDACMVYDFGVAADGNIATLQEAIQTAYLADGSVEGNEFIPLKDVPRYPVEDDVEKTETVIDQMPLSRMVLGQLKSATSLSLQAFSDGLLHLYYGQQQVSETSSSEAEFSMMVGQFDCRVSRLIIDLPWKQTNNGKTGTLSMVARRAGMTLGGTKITISDAVFRKGERGQVQPDLCDVTITYGDQSGLPNETWKAVPRELEAFSSVINGKAAGDAAANANVLSGLEPFYDFEGDQSLIRVPVDSSASTGAEIDSRPRLSFVSALPDIDLESLEITTTGELLNYQFTYKVDDIYILTSWNDVPKNPVKYFEIFAGSASQDIYTYSTNLGSDTPLFALNVTVSDPPTPIILYPKSASITSSTTIQIRASSEHAERLLLTYAIDTEEKHIDDLPKTVTEFVKALRNNAYFNVLFGIADSLIEGQVLETGAALGPIVGRDKSILFDLIIPAFPESSVISCGDQIEYFAGNQKHDYPDSNDIKKPLTRSIGLFTSHFSEPEEGAIAYLRNSSELQSQTQTRLIADSNLPRSGSWQTRDPKPYQLSLASRNDAMKVDIEKSNALLPRAQRLMLQPSFTVEVWVEPTSFVARGEEADDSNYGRLLSFHESISTTDDNETTIAPSKNYAMSLAAQHAAHFESFDISQGSGSGSYAYTNPPTTPGVTFAPPKHFSWEFWIQPDEAAAPENSHSGVGAGIIELIAHQNQRILPLIIGISRERKIQVGWDDNNTQRIETSDGILPYEQSGQPAWTHVCLVGRKSADKWIVILYFDGRQDTVFNNISFRIDAKDVNQVRLRIGAGLRGSAAVFGKLSSLRYWGRALTPAEIQIDRFLSVDNKTPSLWGSWPLSRIVKRDGSEYFENVAYTGESLDAMIYENKQAVTTKADGVFQSIIGYAGGGESIQALASLRTGQWNHVAMRFRAGGGINLNPDESFDNGNFDFVALGNSIVLNPGNAFSIDAWIYPKSALSDRIIMSRWIDSSANDIQEGKSYRLYLNEQGDLCADINCIYYNKEGKSNNKPVSVKTTDHPLENDQAYHVALTFYIASKIEKRSNSDHEEVKKFTPRASLLIDGVSVKSTEDEFQEYLSIEVQPSDIDTFIGCLATPNKTTISDQCFFRGAVGQTQFWDQSIRKELLFPEKYRVFWQTRKIKPLCRWRFQEQQGLIAYDSAGSKINGKLNSTKLWTSFNDTSQLEFFANGSQVWLTENFRRLKLSGNYFSIGDASNAIESISGNIAEVRIWSSFKSDEELQNFAFTTMAGDERGLLAYWNFNGQSLNDKTGGENDGQLLGSAKILPGNYPVSNEPPAVRNVYGGVENGFQSTTNGRIASAEYSDVQESDSDQPNVILKRIVIGNPLARWREPIGVGELEVRYLGQAQSKPKLMGYIEGAPPLPGENLTVPYYESPFLYHKYVDTATVSVEEENMTELSFSSGNSWLNDISASFNTSLFGGSNVTFSAYTPFGTASTGPELDLMKIVNIAIGSQWSFGQSVDAEKSFAWSRSISDQMGSGGDWEPFQESEDNYVSPHLGRRYLLGNLGYALVESIIADHYALFIRRTGTAVGTILLPNPDSQPDRNIILFPLNSQRTKAGSLDGKVGWERDPDVLSHSYTGIGSYYRPNEAYKMEQELRMQEARALAYSAQFDARDTGRTRSSLKANERLNEVPETAPSRWEEGGLITDSENPTATPAWGICNRYVWTANGGLHSETETFSTTRSSSHGSNFGWDFSAGVNVQGDFKVKEIGLGLGFDLAYSHHLQAHLSQGKSLSQGLSLSVNVEGEANLKKWNPNVEQEGRKGAFSAGDHPGKVQAYRFMSFYLPPDEKHGKSFKTEVVDQTWLKSRDATAIMLNNMEDGEPWRVLHRVTYVDRVPPQVASRPAYTQKKNVESIVNLQGNQELVTLVMHEIDGVATPLKVGQAVAKVMNPNDGDAILINKIPWWSDLLHEASNNSDTAATLERMMRNVTAYINTGIKSNQIGKQDGPLLHKPWPERHRMLSQTRPA